MRIKEIKQVISVVEDAKKKIEKMNNTYPKKYHDELQEIGLDVVTRWYASYEPFMYERTLGLKKAFDVKLEGTNYRVDFSPDLMDDVYEVEKEYIYENSFVGGYHGGAIDGPGHPNPGIPYWRTSHFYNYGEATDRTGWRYDGWGRPAKKSPSPYHMMKGRMQKKIKEIDREKQEEFDKIVDRVKKSVNRLRR